MKYRVVGIRAGGMRIEKSESFDSEGLGIFETEKEANEFINITFRRARIKRTAKSAYPKQTLAGLIKQVEEDIEYLERKVKRLLEDSTNGKETGLKGAERLSYVQQSTQLFTLTQIYRHLLAMED